MRPRAARQGLRIVYATDGAGRWIRREWKRQCSEGVFLGVMPCQGVDGHQGVHWAFSADGSFKWDRSDRDLQGESAACGSVPPMRKHYYLNHYTDKQITDAKVIAMLEKDEPPERGATIDRPVRPEELERMGLRERVGKIERARRRKR